MKRYALGFLFSNGGTIVALIQKARPDWQAGLLNGIGGKVEPGEEPAQAMSRKFYEEAGVHTTPIAWTLGAVMSGWDAAIPNNPAGCEVYVYYRHNTPDLSMVRTVTDERVVEYSVDNLAVRAGAPNLVPNLRVLLPLLSARGAAFELPVHFTFKAVA